jgi:uncharacterized protein YbjT (DUF2867 family)
VKVILFGGTGMVGQGVLHECMGDSQVEEVLSVVRKSSGAAQGKVVEMVHEDFFKWSDVAERFEGYDACFFCLGVSAAGMSEAEYRRTTYDLTVSVANTLVARGVKTFIYVSGWGTNTKSRQMWARVKGETEDALMRMDFEGVYCFRPGYIQPMHGIKSKVGWYNTFYAMLGWLYPVLKKVLGNFFTDTDELGRAMVEVSAEGWPCRVLEMRDIVAAGRK